MQKIAQESEGKIPMIIAIFQFDNAMIVSGFIKTTKKGEYRMDFNAVTLDGKLRESRTKIVSDSYVRARLRTCRRRSGTIALVENGVVTYKCDYE